ncbi:MAG: TIR domain-containing protein [Zhenhengia sp.]|uniref:TIR domain-containing protein n=1 Tax=Zhenhengia sp. TaxID=2944208 RepID=UPI003994A5E0
MGRKIFISYKYGDTDVNHIVGEWYETNRVRDYVDKLEEYLKDKSEHIYKGESEGEDLSHLSDEAIWNQLKDRIRDSSLTIVLISKNMKDIFVADREQWIPWEISYSLKEVSRKNSSGQSITSKTNAMLAIVIPDRSNDYSYYTYNKSCCDSGCRVLDTYKLFDIIKANMFNIKTPNTSDCNDGSKVYYGESSYIISVKWDDFISTPEYYIDKAYEIQDNIDLYKICKEV